MTNPQVPNVHPATRILSMNLGAAFAQLASECVPAIQDYMKQAGETREVSFGCRVRFWLDKEDVLRAQMVPTTPKLPTVECEKTEFTLAWTEDGQLAFGFVGDAPPVPAPVTAQPQPITVLPDPSPNPKGNGANPSPVPETTKPPLPPLRGDCPSVMTNGEHDWRPIENEPGVFFCICGARASKSPVSETVPPT